MACGGQQVIGPDNTVQSCAMAYYSYLLFAVHYWSLRNAATFPFVRHNVLTFVLAADLLTALRLSSIHPNEKSNNTLDMTACKNHSEKIRNVQKLRFVKKPLI